VEASAGLLVVAVSPVAFVVDVEVESAGDDFVASPDFRA
jgi:hypothetical protein